MVNTNSGLVVLVVLLIANGLLASARSALVGASHARLRQMVESQTAGAALALRVAEDATPLIATIRLAQTSLRFLAAGLIEEEEKEMIYSIFDMGNTLAREIMVPRIDVLALNVSTPLPQAVDAVLAAGHSRVPIYQGNIDNVVGLLYAKDLLRAWKDAGQGGKLSDLMRP